MRRSRRAPFACVGRCASHPLSAAVTALAFDPTAQQPAALVARHARVAQQAKAAAAAALPPQPARGQSPPLASQGAACITITITITGFLASNKM